jgi:hypothetical protein
MENLALMQQESISKRGTVSLIFSHNRVEMAIAAVNGASQIVLGSLHLIRDFSSDVRTWPSHVSHAFSKAEVDSESGNPQLDRMAS